MKQHLFRGATQYYQSQVCGAGAAVGEQIARLQAALAALEAGGVRGAVAVRGGPDPLGEVWVRATRALAAARKDNDFIYHERVPDPATLEPVPRAAIAKPLPLPERWSADNKGITHASVDCSVRSSQQESTNSFMWLACALLRARARARGACGRAGPRWCVTLASTSSGCIKLNLLSSSFSCSCVLHINKKL